MDSYDPPIQEFGPTNKHLAEQLFEEFWPTTPCQRRNEPSGNGTNRHSYDCIGGQVKRDYKPSNWKHSLYTTVRLVSWRKIPLHSKSPRKGE